MRFAVLFALSAFALPAMTGCAQKWRGPEATARTYTEARVSIPRIVKDGTEVTAGHFGFFSDEATQEHLRAIAARGVRMPVVVYLHGCTGFRRMALYDVEYASKLGAVVIAPDSYARPDRPSGCDSANYKHLGWESWAARFDEITYVADRLQTEPWADPGRLILYGFSEGGYVVAGTRDARFSGYIITGANCNSPGYHQIGIYAPKSKPVLVIRSVKDTWARTEDICDRFLEGRPHSVSVMIQKPGHYLNNEDEAKQAIRTFLKNTIQLRAND